MLGKLLEFAKAHWRIIAVIVILILAFLGGRYTTPTKVVETERIVYQEKIVEKIVEKKVEVAAKTKVVYRTTTITKEGETKIVEVEKTEKKTEKKTDSETNKDKEIVKEDTRTKLTEYARPQWKVGALVGYDFSPVKPLDFAHGLTLGAHVERRLAGPIWVGVWAFHTGAVGASLSVEF
jgi:hypothetical protein